MESSECGCMLEYIILWFNDKSDPIMLTDTQFIMMLNPNKQVVLKNVTLLHNEQRRLEVNLDDEHQ